jgi:murein tripeptide amidase MpaA
MDKDRQAEYKKTRAAKGEKKMKNAVNYLSQYAKSKTLYLNEGNEPQRAIGED